MKPLQILKKTAYVALWGAMGLTLAIPEAALSQSSKDSMKESGEHAAKTNGQFSKNPTAQDIANAKSQGLVWVNTGSHKYHKSGSEYGKSKNGKFMTEAEARQQGYNPAQDPAGDKTANKKKDQSGLDSSIETHSSTPPKQ